jgi:serine/threonine protein kinase
MSGAELDPDRWREIDALFEATLEKSEPERQAFLAGLPDALRRDVERLLEADLAARTFLESRAGKWLPPVPDASRPAPAEPPAGAPPAELPKRIGPYKVLGVIGEGGMGRVLLAARADEQYQRLVAIKTLRPRAAELARHGPKREGQLREELLARFDLERQALAQLEHPNIARLYDAGRDENGDPYLVLEHIDGVPLDQYCDRQCLDVEARLRLFLEVCTAVQAAHRNLVVHRDLKPSNILVTPDGRPMLLDFGIAKLLDPGRIAGELLETREGSRPMTPGYASPEQVKGEPITTASDVYSLGVLLYELLTGRKPYRVTSWAPRELEKAICEDEPERPSTAVFRPAGHSDPRGASPPSGPEELARRRGSSPGALSRHLRGDLDTLLHTALRKDPDLRYASVEALGQDIRAYLEGQPLAARPKARLYAFRKFVRRHRFAAAAAAAVATLLLFFLTALMIQARQILAERDKAQQALHFLIEVFKASDPARAQGEELKAREILDGAARRVEKELAAQPELQATLMDAMGQVYHSLGLYPEAKDLLRKSLELRLRELGENHPDSLATRVRYGRALIASWEFDAARGEIEKAIAGRPEGAPDDAALAELLGDLGRIDDYQDRREPAVELRRRAAAILAATGAPFERRLAAKADLIGALLRAHHFEELDPLMAELKRETGELMGAESDSLEMAEILYEVAEQLWQFGDLRAEALHRRALEIRRKWLAEEHPALIRSAMTLAFLLDFEERYQEALAINQPLYETLRSKLGLDHQSTIDVEMNLAVSYSRLGRFEEALPLIVDAKERSTRLNGDPSAGAAIGWMTQAAIERDSGDTVKAERTLLEAEKRFVRLPPRQVDPTQLQIAFSRLRRAQKDYPAAVAHIEKALVARRAAMGERDWRFTFFRSEYADLLVEVGRPADAEREAIASYDSLARNYGIQTAMVKKPLRSLIALYRRQGREDEARRLEPAIENVELRPAKIGAQGG